MAHNIDTTTGRAAFFSLRQPAWHGLGTVVQEPVSLENGQKLAGLDWRVDLVPISAQVPQIAGIGGDGEFVHEIGHLSIPSHVATRRSDTGAILGVVGADWTPVQNDDLFAWLRQLGMWGDLILETAGSLGRGETVWALVRMDDLNWKIDEVDSLRPYLFVSNGHDGKRAVTIAPMYVRPVCANTMRMAHAEFESRHRKNGDGLAAGWKLNHTSEVHARMEEARKVLEGTTAAWEATKQAIGQLIDQTFDEALLAGIVRKVWRDEEKEKIEAGDDRAPEKLSKATETRMANRVTAIRQLLSAPTNTTPSAKGTTWGAYNALTEYIDHENPTRVTAGRDPQEVRFASTQFGRGDVLKTRAWSAIRSTLKDRPLVTVG